MKQEEQNLAPGRSISAALGQLILSASRIGSTEVNLIVGRVGSPNVERELRVGGVVLYETPDDGLIEVRVTRLYLEFVGSFTGGKLENQATVLLSQVSPRGGLVAGFPSENASNAPFSQSELDRIRTSLQQAGETVAQRAALTREQHDYLERKLEEMTRAADRMGRKDWTNLAIGTLTNTVIAAALNPEAAKAVFQVVVAPCLGSSILR